MYHGNRKFVVRGVTYGTFAPGSDGSGYPADEVVDRDFASMARHGFNAVRTYTAPPPRILDRAQEHGLRVMVGIPWAQHITFLDDRGHRREIRSGVESSVRASREHPAILCYSVGNEIPQSIVRWHGRKRVERFIGSLYDIVKSQDPESLVTYVNYPTTEYLQLSFLDLVCFNVFLEARESLEAYLARLHNLADDRPLLLTEIGLDSRRHGEQRQARTLGRQIQSAFASGCAGTFVFSWTDEWFRGGHEIEDWRFGLTNRQREPKPALAGVSEAYRELPFPHETNWPFVSVVICTFNGSRTIRETLEWVTRLNYPGYEVIVIDDGSTDGTADIANEFDVRVIRTPNRGLSHARNTGWKSASGEIVAYIDDDAYPDPDWLSYLANVFMNSDFQGAGGPNLAPPGDGLVAACVANAAGGPIHVLISDVEAEHIPGCNMAFRRSALEAVGGFDPRFRVAGDDVDICWSLQSAGYRIGFSPAATVWHHRRNSVRTYWRQQKGYGKAEALLQQKWPEKYNTVGHVRWIGRLYGKGLTLPLPLGRSRVYGGIWGTAPFQSLYEPAPGRMLSLTLMPEWYLLIGLLTLTAMLAVVWNPIALEWPLLAVAVAIPLIQAVRSAARARFSEEMAPISRVAAYGLTTALYLMQPAARLLGRLSYGLTPWRRHSNGGTAVPRPRRFSLWSESWRAHDEWIRSIESALLKKGVQVVRGDAFDPWDLHTRGGVLGSTRLLVGVEEHGAGRQLVRFKTSPIVSRYGLAVMLLLLFFLAAASYHGSWWAAGFIGALCLLLVLRILQEAGDATATFEREITALMESTESES